jgi:hypothetical protein
MCTIITIITIISINADSSWLAGMLRIIVWCWRHRWWVVNVERSIYLSTSEVSGHSEESTLPAFHPRHSKKRKWRDKDKDNGGTHARAGGDGA